MTSKEPTREKRFLDRIGKRVYRDDIGCCKDCKKVAEEWLVIYDENHARYLCSVEWDYAAEWNFCNYRDEK